MPQGTIPPNRNRRTRHPAILRALICDDDNMEYPVARDTIEDLEIFTLDIMHGTHHRYEDELLARGETPFQRKGAGHQVSAERRADRAPHSRTAVCHVGPGIPNDCAGRCREGGALHQG